MKEKWSRLKRKKWIFVGAAAILVIAVIAASFVRAGRARGEMASASAGSAKVQKGNISTTVVGTGALVSADTTDITVPIGIKIDKVLVESGDTVKKGQKLATVDEASVAELLLDVREALDDIEDEIEDLSDDAKDSDSDEYLKKKALEGEKEDLKETKKTLEKLLDTKTIKASCDGVVDTVCVEDDTEVTQSGSSQSTDSTQTTTQTAALTTMSAAKETTAQTTAMTTMSAAKQTTATTAAAKETSEETQTDGGIMLLSAGDAASENADDNEGISDTDSRTKISDCSVSVAAPATGNKPQTELSGTDYFTGTISWNCATETFQADTVYIATIKLTANDGYVFSDKIRPEVAGATVKSEVLESDSGDSILRITATFAKTGSASQQGGNAGGSAAAGNDSQNAKDSADSQSEGKAGANAGARGTVGGSISGGSIAAGSVGGSVSASGSSSSGTTNSSTEYNVYETAAFSIASGEKMAVSVNIDELDILSVEEGQSAAVTVDALDGEEFEGTITKISAAVTSGSGSTKYPVEITLEKSDNMLAGMSASATIQVEESQDALLIPVSAVWEKGDQTFVYTKQDDEGNLSGETQVQTGLSDGEQVEITEGLSEGDTVYYLRSQSDESSADDAMQGGAMGGNMQGGFGGRGSGSAGERGSQGGPQGGPQGD